MGNAHRANATEHAISQAGEERRLPVDVFTDVAEIVGQIRQRKLAGTEYKKYNDALKHVQRTRAESDIAS